MLFLIFGIIDLIAGIILLIFQGVIPVPNTITILVGIVLLIKGAWSVLVNLISH